MGENLFFEMQYQKSSFTKNYYLTFLFCFVSMMYVPILTKKRCSGVKKIKKNKIRPHFHGTFYDTIARSSYFALC